jgi:multiple sugar transport system substrate-binding protein
MPGRKEKSFMSQQDPFEKYLRAGFSGSITRRNALKLGGSLAFASTAGSLLAACGGSSSTTTSSSSTTDKWKQFSGTTLNFISENTSPSSAIAANSKPFTDMTGIKVNIQQMELGALVQKVALDFGSGNAQYHVIYADPYQVLAPFSKGLVDLNQFVNDGSLPAVPKGISDFIPAQLEGAGRFMDTKALYALPYDCPTMIWIYRKDLFEKYHDQMQKDLGFDPTPSDNSTWDQYYQIADWFNKNAKADVPYGTGHQAKQYDSLQCDFSNILWAYGGQYFKDEQTVGTLGTDKPGPCMLDQPAAIQAATFYQKLLKIAHPGSTSWDWDGVGKALAEGQIAMAPEWHEYAASVEGGKFGGKWGYARLPKGPARSANIYGGTGIGINKNASDQLQKAAWLFVVWATSPDTQVMDLKSKVGGGTPTRTSVYELPEVQAAMKQNPSPMPNILSAAAVNEAWKPENVGMRPKIPTWNQCDTIIFTELSKMLVANQAPDVTMKNIKAGIDKANKV